MIREHLIVLIVLQLVMFGSGANAQAVGQSSQSELVRQLQGSRSDQASAVARVRQIRPENVRPELRAALIMALERESRLVARELRGEIPHLEHAELIGGLAQLVSAFRDPRSIVALAGALGNSPPATSALAEFGELAASAVLQVLESSSNGDAEVDALVTLRFMAEGVGGPLSGETWNHIRQVARERLITPQTSIVTVWRAIDLAVALGDVELRSIVQSLASDRNAVIALRNADADLIDRTQRRAAARLAGAPPGPQYESSEEFARRWK